MSREGGFFCRGRTEKTPPCLRFSICKIRGVFANLYIVEFLDSNSTDSLCPFSQDHSGMPGQPSAGLAWVGAVASEGLSAWAQVGSNKTVLSSFAVTTMKELKCPRLLYAYKEHLVSFTLLDFLHRQKALVKCYLLTYLFLRSLR